jgi:uncharacterized protein (TIGR00730 family)
MDMRLRNWGMPIDAICVFCGAGKARNPVYNDRARELGNLIAERNIKLVYGGASVGLMGTVADGVLEKGGDVYGILPDFLFKKEVGHTGIQKLEIVDSMHIRKQKMYESSDAFIILPGGIGTLDEFFEVFTWSQLELHNKPIGLYNINNYFNKLLNFISETIAEGFFSEDILKKLNISTHGEELLDTLTDLSEKTLRLDRGDKL